MQAWIFAFIIPVIWAFMNVLDKYVVSHRVKNALGFSIIAGITNIMIGTIIALFLDWRSITLSSAIAPAFAGILLGADLIVYYFILKHEDASYLIDLVYSYPLILTVLSILVLNEVLPFTAYVGLALITIGIVILGLRLRKLKLHVAVWLIVINILTVASYEFLIKVSTTEISEWHGIALNQIFLGICVMLMFFYKPARSGFLKELKNAHWTLATEALTSLAIAFTYFAMSELPATLVSSIGALQPIMVVGFEFLAQKNIGNMSRDKQIMPKLFATMFIIAGVIMLTGSVI